MKPKLGQIAPDIKLNKAQIDSMASFQDDSYRQSPPRPIPTPQSWRKKLLWTFLAAVLMIWLAYEIAEELTRGL